MARRRRKSRTQNTQRRPQDGPKNPERFDKATAEKLGREGIRDAAATIGSQMVAAHKESRPLLHYTNAQGLIGIIEGQSLYATHADFLNDSSECKLLAEALSNQLLSEFENERKAMKALGVDHNESQKMVDVVFQMMANAIEKISPFYVTSFCLHAIDSVEYNDGLLSQWRAYANGGFAIEFDELELDKLKIPEMEKFSYEAIITERVAYNDYAEKVEQAEFDGLARATLATIAEIQNMKLEDLGERKIANFRFAFFNALPFLKFHGFSEEREYRLVALPHRPDLRPNLLKRPAKPINFRVSKTGSVLPFIKLFEGLETHLPIKAVIIGPHPNQENQRKAVDHLLAQNRVKAEVRLSKIPFRES